MFVDRQRQYLAPNRKPNRIHCRKLLAHGMLGIPDLALGDEVPLDATQNKEKIIIDIIVGAMVFVQDIIVVETLAQRIEILWIGLTADGPPHSHSDGALWTEGTEIRVLGSTRKRVATASENPPICTLNGNQLVVSIKPRTADKFMGRRSPRSS